MTKSQILAAMLDIGIVPIIRTNVGGDPRFWPSKPFIAAASVPLKSR